MKYLTLFLFFVSATSFGQAISEYKVAFEVTFKPTSKQILVLHESNASGVNGALAHAQVSKTIESGWRHTYKTTEVEEPLMLKAGTASTAKHEITIKLYVNDKLVATKTGKAGNFMTSPLSMMVYINDIKDKL